MSDGAVFWLKTAQVTDELSSRSKALAAFDRLD